MTFFEQQHKARKKTGILILYFILAIILIVIAINAAIYLIVTQATTPSPSIAYWIEKPYWIWIAGATLFLITMGTLNTMFKLRGGGRAVAEIVGARRVNPNTKDLNERKLINVVEEMSIASGTPVPAIYVLDDESSINAFVAGLRPTEVVLVATRGTLENLDRDELQGVIAHEYSHIMNGDMRINIRLMGILAGILIIGQLGRILLRSTGRSRGKGGGQAAMIGLALFIIGYIGLFFGALIKAAISRQREFLADASAVQFTRNPSGIAGAIWKIKQHTDGSLLNNSHSDDISHFCFGESVKAGFSSVMATHPPLDMRIKAIDPHFVPKKKTEPKLEAKKSQKVKTEKIIATAATSTNAITSSSTISTSANAIVQNVGNVSPAHIGFAAALLASIPNPIETAVHQTDGARQVVYALLLGATGDEHHEKGQQIIKEAETEAYETAVKALLLPIKSLGDTARLPLLNMAIPALKQLDQEACAQFLTITEALIKLDKRLSVFEFALLTILQEHLKEGAEKDIPVKYFKFKNVMEEIKLLLSVMARVGTSDEKLVHITYQKIMKQFTPEPGGAIEESNCKLDALNSALHKLNMTTPLLKKSIIQACADCVIHDGKVIPREAEMLQAISVSLDCPMPPLLEP